MILEVNKYLSKYYGIYRDINMINSKILIRFNAYLYDELDIEYEKEYKTVQEALNEINVYIDRYGKFISIDYSQESIDRVNNSIFNFLIDVAGEKIDLPGEGYMYKGDIEHLRKEVQKGPSQYIEYR